MKKLSLEVGSLPELVFKMTSLERCSLFARLLVYLNLELVCDSCIYRFVSLTDIITQVPLSNVIPYTHLMLQLPYCKEKGVNHTDRSTIMKFGMDED